MSYEEEEDTCMSQLHALLITSAFKATIRASSGDTLGHGTDVICGGGYMHVI
jgi:hypothetical protein